MINITDVRRVLTEVLDAAADAARDVAKHLEDLAGKVDPDPPIPLEEYLRQFTSDPVKADTVAADVRETMGQSNVTHCPGPDLEGWKQTGLWDRDYRDV